MFDYDDPQNYDSNIATHVAFKDNMNDQADDAYDGRLRTNRRSRTGDADCLFREPRTFLEIKKDKMEKNIKPGIITINFITTRRGIQSLTERC